MVNKEKDIRRRIKVRNFAIKNTGNYSEGCESMNIEKNNNVERLINTYSENINEAILSKDISGYARIYSNRRVIGKAIVIFKRAIRKFIHVSIGWYVKPIYENQSYTNGKIINAISSSHELDTLRLQELQNRVDVLQSENDSLSETIKKMEEKLNTFSSLINDVDYMKEKLNITCDINLINKYNFDYKKFEDLYRGTREGIKKIQEVYIPYYKNNYNCDVIDIGSGRGEFLELLMEHGISSYGIDTYKPFVEYCTARGLIVKESDALTYLTTLPDNSIGGIFMSQVIEHVSSDYAKALIKTAYAKLKTGCYFILETPNPDCLAAISEFNIDMTHTKPVHYKALEYIFKEEGYQSVVRYHTEGCKYPVNAYHLDGENIHNLEKFNEGIDHINELLFGFRDYTLIAQK